MAMPKRRKVLLWIAGGFLIFALSINTPGMLRAINQKRVVDTVFGKYAKALATDNFREAYEQTGADFRERTDFDAFVAQHRELESARGFKGRAGCWQRC
jgi:hypothetical protein